MDSPAQALAPLLDRERVLLNGIAELLDLAGSPSDTQRRLSDLADSLDELFLLVVAGEFNAGKSTLVNALFGRRVMEEGPVPTTDKITVLRYGEEEATHRRSEFVTEHLVPHPLLQHLALVDTPGTNSIVREHQILTEDFVPRADLVLFVTSYDRPLSESERVFLDYIQSAWGKQLVVAVNKSDLAETEAALAQVLQHVRDGLAKQMGAEASPPLLFPVAARQALAAKEDATAAGTPDAFRADPRWETSRFGPFQRFVEETLGEDTRVALKLTAPLDAASTLLDGIQHQLEASRQLVTQDAEDLQALDTRFAEVRASLDEVLGRTVADVDRELLEMERRGVRFLDDTIRVSRLHVIRDRNAFREEFDRQVVRDSERRIEERLGEAADGILRRVFDLWKETYGRLTDFRQRTGETQASDGFLYDRDEVLRDVLREARRTIETYDMGEEARRLLENARSGITVGGAAAVGLGAVAVLLIYSTVFDITGGILAAGAVAALGFIVLPMQRRRAVKDFSARIEALRGELREALHRELSEEVEAAIQKVRALVDPVRMLVASQHDQLEDSATRVAQLAEESEALRADVRRQFGEATVQG
ncbi:MAG: dynamin family protein [Rubricoccaceae bacterium]